MLEGTSPSSSSSSSSSPSSPWVLFYTLALNLTTDVLEGVLLSPHQYGQKTASDSCRLHGPLETRWSSGESASHCCSVAPEWRLHFHGWVFRSGGGPRCSQALCCLRRRASPWPWMRGWAWKALWPRCCWLVLPHEQVWSCSFSSPVHLHHLPALLLSHPPPLLPPPPPPYQQPGPPQMGRLPLGLVPVLALCWTLQVGGGNGWACVWVEAPVWAIQIWAKKT